MKNKILVVVATEEELDLAKKFYPNKKIIKTGVGALNVINILKNIDKKTEIINVGYAGSNNIKKNTTVPISKSILYHPNVNYNEQEFELDKIGVNCYTSNDFVLNTDIKEPVVFDMELAFICALGFEKVTSIKVISDNLSYKEYEENING